MHKHKALRKTLRKALHKTLRKTLRNRKIRRNGNRTHKGMVFSNIYGWRKIKNLKTRKH